MIICQVVGHLWATKKEEGLCGMKLMVVRPVPPCDNSGMFVAADAVGAGIGEKVLVVSGSTARVTFGSGTAPVDAAIVGIIDSLELEDGC
jgi:ethanolamine utilization protein EutN